MGFGDILACVFSRDPPDDEKFGHIKDISIQVPGDTDHRFQQDSDVVVRIIWDQHTNVLGASLHGQLSQIDSASTQGVSETKLLQL